MLKWLTLAATLLLSISAARAEWKLITAPDASMGGERTTLAGQADQGLEVAALCNGANRAFNLILPDWQKDLGAGRAMTLTISNDSGGEIGGSATTFRSEAGDFTGIAFDAPEQLEAIVRVIAAAEASISISVVNEVWGVETVYYAAVSQPFDAARDFARTCGFAEIAPVTPAGPAPAAWTVSMGLGSPTTEMRGEIADGVELGFSCDAGSGAASLVIRRSSAAGGGVMVGPANATLVVDGGRLHTSPVSIDIGADGGANIYYSDSTLVPGLLIDLAAAQAKILLELYYPATGTHDEWQAQGRVAVAAAAQLVEACGLVPRPAYAAPDPRLVPPTPGTWIVEEAPAPNGRPTQALSARTIESNGRLVVHCDGDNALSLSFVTEVLTSLPVRETEDRASIIFELNGQGHPIGMAVAVSQGDFGVLVYDGDMAGSASVDGLLLMFREATTPVRMSIWDADLMDVAEVNLATDNLAAEANRFLDICLYD